MGLVAVLLLLLAYNNLLNLWPPFNRWLYVPANVALTIFLIAVGVVAFGLELVSVTGRGAVLPAIAAGTAGGALVTAPLFAALASRRWAARIADRRLSGLDRSAAAYQILVRIPIGTALLEEVAFRGVVLAALRHLGDVEAAIWSSVAFGLWHIGPTRNLVRANRPRASAPALIAAITLAVAGTTAAGLGFVWFRLWTGSLWGPWALHATLNSLATLAALLAHARTGEETEQPAGGGIA